MRRVISIFLPYWPIEARIRRTQRASPDKASEKTPDKAPEKSDVRPFVLIGQDGQKQILTAVNPAAAAEGLTPGMPLAHARAIAPQVQTAPAQPLEDAKALHSLAGACVRFSPWVSVCGADGVWIDATGVAHLFGGEQAMVAKIAKVLARNGLSARVAMASNPGAAWALAHYAQAPIVISSAKEDLDPLPVMALRVGAEVARSLWRVGIKTIGALKAIPRATLPLRFGKNLVLRLDQALGHAAEAIDCMVPPEARRREIAFAEPISTGDDIRRTAAKLVHELCGDLDAKQEGARKLDLVFRRADNTLQAIRIGTGRASRDPAHLLKLFGEHLDTVAPGFGIDGASLTAWKTAPLFPTQTDSEGAGAAHDGDLAMLTDHLANRLGPRSVYRLMPVATHIPERAQICGAPMLTSSSDGWPAALPRPVRLFSPPEPVDVMALLPDHPPARFSWRGVIHKIRCADGPERVCGEWWLNRDEVSQTRDYFRVEDEEGARYWLFRDNRLTRNQNHLWFLHGIFA
jgi:protein ImuB